MQIGILDLDVRTVSPCLTGARAAEQAGFDTYWLSGGWRDPVTLATAAGCAVPPSFRSGECIRWPWPSRR